MGKEGEIRVTVPARPDFLHVIRSVTASVAARLDLAYDDIDDLRIAVDEASAELLKEGGSSSILTLSITTTGDRVEVVVCTDGDVKRWPPPGVEGTLIWQVLAGLTEYPSFERFEGYPAMRLVKSVASGAGR